MQLAYKLILRIEITRERVEFIGRFHSIKSLLVPEFQTWDLLTQIVENGLLCEHATFNWWSSGHRSDFCEALGSIPATPKLLFRVSALRKAITFALIRLRLSVFNKIAPH